MSNFVYRRIFIRKAIRPVLCRSIETVTLWADTCYAIRWNRVLPITLMIFGWLNSLTFVAQTASSQRGLADTSPLSSFQIGPYYALIIGNQNYKYLKKLQTPINDANEIERLLRERYRFQTKLLLDADRKQILTALGEYRRTLAGSSNLLIYYAGHGYHDRDVEEAYWLPVDAQADNNANWISADDITRNLKAIPSSHVLVISDSCYSGYLVASRSGNVGINPAERHALLAKMLGSKSRNLMSSGGDEPVADTGAPGHSVFAAAVLDGFRRIEEDNFTAADLFQQFIQPAVGGRSLQLPQYSAIRNSGHEYGDFVFSRQPPGNEPTSARAPARVRGEAEDSTGSGPDLFDLTVRPHAKGVDVINSGKIVIDFDNTRLTADIASNGEANFKGLPTKFRGATVNVLPQIDGYWAKWREEKLTGGALDLLVEARSQLTGTIIPPPENWKTLRVMLEGQDDEAKVDERGRFSIPVQKVGTDGRVRLFIYDGHKLLKDDLFPPDFPITLKLKDK